MQCEHSRTGAQRDGKARGWGYNGDRAQWNRGHNRTERYRDGDTMGLGHNGTGAQWDGSTMGRKGTWIRTQ